LQTAWAAQKAWVGKSVGSVVSKFAL
jgi:hypothetical protein